MPHNAHCLSLLISMGSSRNFVQAGFCSGLSLSCFIFPLLIAVCTGLEDVTTYRIGRNYGKVARGGSSMVYACNAGKETGPCVDTPFLCTSQGGRFVGYCFFDGRYEGVCCVGLDPSNATLTTTTKNPNSHDDTTTSAPGLPTQTMPPSSTLSTLPSSPVPSETPPTMTTQSLPSSSSVSTQTLPPSSTVPPPPPPTQSPPPGSSTVVHDDTTTTTRRPLFPTMTTQQSNTTIGFPTNMTFTTQKNNGTTQQMNFTMTTQASNSSRPGFTNMTTQPMPTFPTITTTTTTTTTTTSTEAPPSTEITIDATQTTATPSSTEAPPSTEITIDATSTEAPPSTEITIDATQTTSAATEAPPSTEITIDATSETTTTSTEAAPPPPADIPQDEDGGSGGCGVVTSEIESLFQNPSYPSLDTEPNSYQYSVIPREGYCALRIEFVEAIFEGKGAEGCNVDSVTVITTIDSPTTPMCGLLQGYQFTINQDMGPPTKLVVTTQSSAYLWSIKLIQIPCSNIKSYQDYESPDCGIRNPKQMPPGLLITSSKETPKEIHPLKLLKAKRKALRDIMTTPQLEPSKILQSAVLHREANIKIVRGNETGVNEYPWQALLMLNGRPLCGASVINEEWVVTAGHCVNLNLRYPLMSVLTVDLGDHDLHSSKETKNIVSRISRIVPNVQTEGVRNDIALIKLATRIPFSKTIRPVCLPVPKTPADTFVDQEGITTGWGRTEDSVISPVLREAILPIISHDQCRRDWSNVGEGAGNIIDGGMICAGGGDVGPCNGESGGPLVVYSEDRYRLVGMTSFGLLRGCAVPGVPSVFTRITTFVDWIALNLAEP